MKIFVYIMAIVLCLSIGLYQTQRIYNVYTVPKLEVSSVIVEKSEEPIVERNVAEIRIPDSSVSDSASIVEEPTESNREVPTVTEEVVTEQGHYVPSDIALEVEFWVDIISSLMTAIAPILVPFIIYRKKNNES